MTTRLYQPQDYVAFKRGKDSLVGTILAMDPIGVGQNSRQDRRKVLIETDVPDQAGKLHHGNVTVNYSAIIGLAEKPTTAQVTP